MNYYLTKLIIIIILADRDVDHKKGSMQCMQVDYEYEIQIHIWW